MINELEKNELSEVEMDSVAGGNSFIVSSQAYDEAMREILKKQEEGKQVTSINIGDISSW